MAPEPLPCPFCGSKDIVVDPDIESVTCNGCTATGPSMLRNEYDSDDAMMDAAISAWNARIR
jgi:Lar family restriction alleviation protein